MDPTAPDPDLPDIPDAAPLPAWSPEDVPIPNIDDVEIEDGVPVESQFIEKLLRLLTETLYSSWPGPGEGRTFKALANVGLFYQDGQPPLVPDVMLSLDVPANVDLSRKENRSYFVWIVGKVPDVVIEVVSDRLGGELTHKMRDYVRFGVPYYVVFDPLQLLGEEVLRVFELRGRTYVALESAWLPEVGLGLVLWQGSYEGQEGRWLRWCDQQGKVIPTGRERANQAEQRIDQVEQQAERLRAQLRAAGIEPTE